MSLSLRKLIFSYVWDTRCRNTDVARILEPLLKAGSTIIDAGCGEYGIAAFLPGRKIVGVDIIPTDTKVEGFAFVHGSILDLPFDARSFSIATSIDVLEHLPEDLRPGAIEQLVKVARDAVVITFPSGADAREIDEAFEKTLKDTGQPIPDWVSEHLSNRYPETDEIVAEIKTQAEKAGRLVRITNYYSERRSIAKFLRWSAARSRYVYMAGNLFAGFFLPIIRRTTKENAYRSIILAEFINA